MNNQLHFYPSILISELQMTQLSLTLEYMSRQYVNIKLGHDNIHAKSFNDALPQKGSKRKIQWVGTVETQQETGTQTTKVDLNMELSYYQLNSSSRKSASSFSFSFFSSLTAVTAAVGSSRHHRATSILLLPSKETSEYHIQLGYYQLSSAFSAFHHLFPRCVSSLCRLSSLYLM